MANPAIESTSSSQNLSIEISNPIGVIEQSDEILLSGIVGLGEQLNSRTSILYVVDLSGSTEEAGNDCNGDGVVDDEDSVAINEEGIGTILDCEITAVIAINENLGMNEDIDTAVLGFESTVRTDHISDFVSPPNIDKDGNGQADIEDFLINVERSGVFGSGGTNYNIALRQARTLLSRERNAQRIVYFFSDGESEISGIDAAELLAESNIVVNTFPIGDAAVGCENTEIGEIARITGGECLPVSDASSLISVVRQVAVSPPSNIQRVSLSINGSEEVDLPVDSVGMWSTMISSGALTSNTNVVNVKGYATDGTVVTAEINLTTARFEESADNQQTGNEPFGEENSSEEVGGGGSLGWSTLAYLVFLIFYSRIFCALKEINLGRQVQSRTR